MRMDEKEIRNLPPGMQFQVAMALLAQIGAMAPPVAAEGRPVQKCRLRKLCFISPKARWRYYQLRKMQKRGMVCEICGHKNESGKIYGYTFTVTEEF